MAASSRYSRIRRRRRGAIFIRDREGVQRKSASAEENFGVKVMQIVGQRHRQATILGSHDAAERMIAYRNPVTTSV
jgi:hypothetical protein